MTPNQLVALGALLDDFLDWLEETDPGCLDATIVMECGEILLRAQARLVAEGAR